MASDDGWVDYQPAQSSAPPPQDNWVDYQPAQPAAAAPSADGWTDYQPPQREPPPEAEGMLGTAAREVAHGVLPAAAGAGTGLLAAGAAGAALGSFVPGAGTLLGGAVGLGAGLIGGGLGGYAASTAQEEGLKALGADDSVQRAINAKTNPLSSLAGSTAAGLAGFGTGAVGGGVRALSGAISGGTEAAQQIYQGEFDPAKLAASTAMGAVAAKPYGWGSRLEAQGAQLGERVAARYHGPAASEGPSAATEHIPPRQDDPTIGNPYPPGHGSETEGYVKPTPAQARAEAAAGPAGEPAISPLPGVDLTLKAAIDAKLKPPEAPTNIREAIEQRAPGETADTAIRQDVLRRGRDGRPLETAPMDMRPEVGNRILERGAEVAGEPPRGPPPPEMQAMARKGPPSEPPVQDLRPVYEHLVKTKGQEAADRWLIEKHAQADRYETGNLLPGEAARIAARENRPPPPDLTQPMARKGRTVGEQPTPGEVGPEVDAAVARALESPEKISPAAAPVDKTGTLGPPGPSGGGGAGKLPPGGPPGTPPNVGQAAKQGAAPATQTGGGAGTPPGTPPPGAPPLGASPPGAPPSGAGQPNLAHTPPQQRGFFSELLRDVQRKVAAHTLGPEGMEARRFIRGSYGETQRIAEQSANILNKHQETIRAMPEADRWAMINQMQGDNRFPNFRPTAEQQSFMKDFERTSQEWEAKLRTLDAADQMNFRDHYMAQMYENPQAAPNMGVGFGKRGGAGSTKERKFDTYEDAKAAGLVPKTSDPIEIGVRYANSIKDFVASRQVLERAEAAGNVRYIKPPQAIGASGSVEPFIKNSPPPGWKPLNTPEKNGRVAYAPEDFADTFNNFYDKGLAGRNQPLFETLRNSANGWTQLELGLNAYHAFTMANEAVISDVAKGLTKALSGDVRGGFRDIGKAPGAFITRAVEGKRFQQEYLDPNSTNPIASILAEANARPIGRGHAADYTFQDRGSFINKFSPHNLQSEMKQAWKDIQADYTAADTVGQKALFPLRQAGRAIQTVGAPIFDKYIPMLKAGAVHSQMKDWHEAMVRENPNFDMTGNPADRRAAVDAAMKIVDSVDNRFGEMIHDNMFMNATLKQSAQLAMRSFSWAIGAMKEIGGGTYATGKALGKLATTGENRFSSTHPQWDPRMSYAIAFPFVLGTVSSIYQFLRDGEAPTGWRDLYAPRTGGTVPGVGGRGQVPEHVLMPGYQKDVLGWIHHPLQEVYNKLGGLPTTAIEQATGKDWKGEPIVAPGASLPEAAGQRMAHLFSKLSPISIKNMMKGTEPTSNITRLETGLGFRAPGSFIQDPEGLKRALEFKGKREWKAKERKERKTELRQSGG